MKRRATSLGLQGAEAGIAIDYHIRSHVIRVRAEGWQFLLAVQSTTVCAEWIEKINIAAAISPPIEAKIELGYPPIPAPTSKPSPNFAGRWDKIQRR